MKYNDEKKAMQRSVLTTALSAALYFGLAAPLLAAQPAKPAAAATVPATTAASAGETAESHMKPAKQCMTDLRTFDGQMQKDGYWLHGSGRGYGYPIYGYAGERGATAGAQNTAGGQGMLTHSGTSGTSAANDYWRARPGYELRTLIVSANILARRGQQKACEELLTATRAVYKSYSADLRNGKIPRADVKGWRQHQLSTAQPVTAKNTSFRSDQLIGTDVVNPKNEDLGSVDDIVLSPKTGRIAYLVIGRGGVFGIDEKYVPVPWKDFKATTDTNLLVLDITKAKMDAAPQVKEDEFSAPGNFATQSKKVAKYWAGEHSTKKSG